METMPAPVLALKVSTAPYLRYTPELLFELDRNIAYGAHISDILNHLNADGGEKEEE